MRVLIFERKESTGEPCWDVAVPVTGWDCAILRCETEEGASAIANAITEHARTSWMGSYRCAKCGYEEDAHPFGHEFRT